MRIMRTPKRVAWAAIEHPNFPNFFPGMSSRINEKDKTTREMNGCTFGIANGVRTMKWRALRRGEMVEIRISAKDCVGTAPMRQLCIALRPIPK